MFSGAAASAWRGPQPRFDNASGGRKVPRSARSIYAGSPLQLVGSFQSTPSL